jgi:hypothetical protein
MFIPWDLLRPRGNRTVTIPHESLYSERQPGNATL